MKKPPQFVIADNPLVPDSGEWIIHLRDPLLIASATELKSMRTIQDDRSIIAVYLNPDGIVELYLIEVWYPDEKIPAGLLKRTADWYCSYIRWEDAQIGDQGKVLNLKDYNEHIPGLKVIFSQVSKKWGIIWNGLVQSFETEYELDEFLMKYFSDDQLKSGFINQLYWQWDLN